MCVIIIIPRGHKIDEDEIISAWKTNSDGAGYMYRKNNTVFYKRGIMNMYEYIDEVQKIIGKYDIVLHLRISTSDKVNPTQTHPYELGDVMNMEGVTTNPVSCMNGIVHSQRLKMLSECNDTMSYIIQNNELFKAFSTLEYDKDKIFMIDFIKEDTGAKWCIMTPESIFFSTGFTEENGILYSNLNHRSRYYSLYPIKKPKDKTSKILSKKLINKLKKNNRKLYNQVYDYITEYCASCDSACRGCLKKCKDIKDIKKFKNLNYYDFQILSAENYGINDYDFYDYHENDKEIYYTTSVKNDYIFDE